MSHARALDELLSTVLRRRTLVGGLLSAVIPSTSARAKSKRRRCASPRRRCDGRCVEVLSNRWHCGACGNRCGDEQQCLQGHCCDAGLVLCDDTCAATCDAAVRRPFPQQQSYPGARNRITHRTREEQTVDVRTFYDTWKAAYVRQQGEDDQGRPRYWVAYNREKSETVSEAMGYGMILTAIMAGHDPEAQTVFDGLWRFAREHPSERDPRLMAWHIDSRHQCIGGCNSAFDGDADMAYALLLADAQWGSGGTIDYRAAFDAVVAGIMASMIGPESHLPMLGDWVDPTSSGAYSQWSTRTSDFMPAHFRAYGRATGDARWTTVRTTIAAAMETLQTSFAADTGLLPDFAVHAGSPRAITPAAAQFLEGPHDGHYNYNAGRVPWRVGTDAVMADDATGQQQVARISSWARVASGGNPLAFRSGYRLDGTTWSGTDYFSTFFVAPLGVAAMTDAGGADWLAAVYDAVRICGANGAGYYEDSVALLALLVMTELYWDPTA